MKNYRAVGGQPEGLPVPGELPAARAARHQDPRVRGARGRPAAGRAHAGVGRARLPPLPRRVHRGVPADDRGGYVHEPDGRRRAALAPRAVRPDEDRPAPVLLPPRRVLPRGEPVRPSGTRGSKVDVQIDSDRVYPVFAFDRVFVFWPTVETSRSRRRTAHVHRHEDSGTRPARRRVARPRYVVEISYSFYNLNKEWVPPQVLTAEPPIQDTRPISDVRLLVERSHVRRPAGTRRAGPDDGRETIVVRCSYAVQVRHRRTTAETLRLQPHPRAVHRGRRFPVSFDDSGVDRFISIFDEPVTSTPHGESDHTRPAPPEHAGARRVAPAVPAPDVVMFNSPPSRAGPWFSFDYKGGSFLCKPAAAGRDRRAAAGSAAGQERLPDWDAVRRRVHQPRTARTILQTPRGPYVVVDRATARGDPQPSRPASVARATHLHGRTASVDAVLARAAYDLRLLRARVLPLQRHSLSLDEAAIRSRSVEHGRPAALASGRRGVRRPGGRDRTPFERAPGVRAPPNALRSPRPTVSRGRSAGDDKAGKDDEGKPCAGPEPVLRPGPVRGRRAGPRRAHLPGLRRPVCPLHGRRLPSVDRRLPEGPREQHRGPAGSRLRASSPTGAERLPVSTRTTKTVRTRGADRAPTFPTADLGRGRSARDGESTRRACRGSSCSWSAAGGSCATASRGRLGSRLRRRRLPQAVLRSPSTRSSSSAARSTCSRATGTAGWPPGQELDSAVVLTPIEGNWGNLPYRFRAGLDGACSDGRRPVPVQRGPLRALSADDAHPASRFHCRTSSPARATRSSG